LQIEQVGLRDLTLKLNKEITMGMQMDQFLTAKVEDAKGRNEDPDRIRFIEEEIIFPLRQRVMDMQTLITVNHQGIVSMEILQRNNQELIRGVERAKLVTVNALRTAVMIATGLYNQKIVLKKIQMLNTTTQNLIAGTSKMLKEQGTEIHKMATNAVLSPEVLKTAFNDVIGALNDISTFKQEALPKLAENIRLFQDLAEKGEKEIKKLEQGRNVNLIGAETNG
jgi:uncharacterized protein YaaN involved in tellurite resistance